MPLHPQAQAILSGVESMGLPPVETMSVEEQRAVIGTFSSFMMPAEDVATIEDLTIPGPEGDIPLRIYTPEGDGPRPAVVYFHGGGFVTGSVDLVDPICRALANRSGCLVISVDYRLAPEHPYPAAVQDAYVAVAWVSAYGEGFGVDPTRLVVAGDSAGATLATVTCMLIRDKAEEIPIALQVLLCPVMDLVSMETDSYKEYGEGHLLTTAMMQRWKELYLTGCEDRVDEPYCSPIRMPNFANLPPAFIVTAEYDPLRDEGEIYGLLLPRDGVDADIRRQDGMIHNFFWMGAAIDRGREIIDEIAADLRKRLFD
jgi:acetyl esterase